MNKEFAKEYIEWYHDRKEMPSMVNELMLQKFYNKAVQITINSERDGDSYKRVIEEYGIKPQRNRGKSVKNQVKSRKRISKFL